MEYCTFKVWKHTERALIGATQDPCGKPASFQLARGDRPPMYLCPDCKDILEDIFPTGIDSFKNTFPDGLKITPIVEQEKPRRKHEYP